MSEHRFPSAEFPGPVPVRLRVPDGWRPAPTGSAAMAFTDDAPPGELRSSLVVVVERTGGDPTLDEIAARLRDRTSGMAAGSTTLASDAAMVAGRDAIRTVLSVPVPQRAVTLVQAQTVVALDADDHGQRDVVQLHFTCPAQRWTAQEPVLAGVLRSVEIG